MKKMKLPAILISMTLTLAACATPKPPAWKPLSPQDVASTLTLQDCLRLAMQNDIRAADWRARIQSARAELTAARTLPNPAFGASWEDLGVKDGEGKNISNSTYGISFPVFFWWTRDREIAVARKRLSAEQEGVRGDRRRLAIEIGAAYYALLAAGRKTKAQEELLKTAQESQRLAGESYRVGSAAGHDVELARAETTQAEADLLDARHEEHALALAFAFALGADRPVAVHLRESGARPAILSADAMTTAPYPPPALVDRALGADPAYARAKASREAAEAAHRLEQRRMVPLSEATATAARKHDPEGMGYNLGFEIPIPLFDWNIGGVRKARAELLAAQTEEERARRAAIAGVTEAWEAWQAARHKYEAYANKIAIARGKLAQDSADLFAAGQIGYADLQQARREWRQSELAAADAWRESMTAAWTMECQTGEAGPSARP